MTRFDRLIHAALVLGFIAMCAGISSYAHAQTLTFTLETTSPDGQSVVPRLTWQTTPAAQSCTAAGASDWTGTKAASGTVVLAAVTTSRTYGIACNWPGVTKVSLSWTPPTKNTDGSALTNLAGYRVLYGNVGPAPSQLDKLATVSDATARGWTSPNLTPGPWYFAVKAFNTLGLESALTNIVSKTATADAEQNRSLELTIRFPNAPTDLTVE